MAKFVSELKRATKAYKQKYLTWKPRPRVSRGAVAEEKKPETARPVEEKPPVEEVKPPEEKPVEEKPLEEKPPAEEVKPSEE